MAKVVIHWQKADWMSKFEVAKEVKRLVSTCLSYDVEPIVIDADRSLSEVGVSAKVFHSLDEAKLDGPFVLLEPPNVFNSSIA